MNSNHVIEFAAEDLLAAAHLPDEVNVMLKVLGAPATAKLINAYGGLTFPVGLNQHKTGQARLDALVKAIGAEAAKALVAHYGGDVLYVPRCAALRRQARNRRILADFDQLSQTHSGLSTVAILAYQYGISDRMIWRILKSA